MEEVHQPIEGPSSAAGGPGAAGTLIPRDIAAEYPDETAYPDEIDRETTRSPTVATLARTETRVEVVPVPPVTSTVVEVPAAEVAVAVSHEEDSQSTVQLDQQLQACCLPFLQWLPMAPVHAADSVKRRRIFKVDQLTPIKNNLRFIFQQLIDTNALPQGKVQLEALTMLKVCQQLGSTLELRRVGSARVYAIFLLVKKALTYLASVETRDRHQQISPDTFSSYPYVDAL